MYVLPSDIWEFIDLQQSLLKYKLFKKSKVCFCRTFASYLMKNDSILAPYLQYFILMAQDSGLFNYWKEESFRAALKAGHARILDNDKNDNIPLGMEYFYGIFLWLIIGSL